MSQVAEIYKAAGMDYFTHYESLLDETFSDGKKVYHNYLFGLSVPLIVAKKFAFRAFKDQFGEEGRSGTSNKNENKRG